VFPPPTPPAVAANDEETEQLGQLVTVVVAMTVAVMVGMLPQSVA
jgi:hypothetical protein